MYGPVVAQPPVPSTHAEYSVFKPPRRISPLVARATYSAGEAGSPTMDDDAAPAAPTPPSPEDSGWDVSASGVGPRSHFDPLLLYERFFPVTRCWLDSFETQLACELTKPRKRKIEFDKKFPAMRAVLAAEIGAYGAAIKSEIPMPKAYFDVVAENKQLRQTIADLETQSARLAYEIQWSRRQLYCTPVEHSFLQSLTPCEPRIEEKRPPSVSRQPEFGSDVPDLEAGLRSLLDDEFALQEIAQLIPEEELGPFFDPYTSIAG